MSEQTRTRWIVMVAAAVFIAVCVTIVALALVMHPSVPVDPGL